jgi:hypothetical protein
LQNFLKSSEKDGIIILLLRKNTMVFYDAPIERIGFNERI